MQDDKNLILADVVLILTERSKDLIVTGFEPVKLIEKEKE